MIFAIKPFEIHDGDGIRTTVFFKGCPLRCKWCHNPESLSPQKEFLFDHGLCKSCGKCVFLCNANILQDEKHYFLRDNCTLCGKCVNICPHNCFETVGQDLSANEIAEQVLKDEIFMKGSGGGVTFSGGEPLMQVDLCIEIATILKEKNINLAIDTCGAVPRSTIDRIIPFVDTFLFDIVLAYSECDKALSLLIEIFLIALSDHITDLILGISLLFEHCDRRFGRLSLGF